MSDDEIKNEQHKTSITLRREVVRIAVEKEILCFQVYWHASGLRLIPANVSQIILVSTL